MEEQNAGLVRCKYCLEVYDPSKQKWCNQMTMIYDLSGTAGFAILEVIHPYGVATVEELAKADAAEIIKNLVNLINQQAPVVSKKIKRSREMKLILSRGIRHTPEGGRENV